MKFKYCPECGTKLVDRIIGDEGAVPYCERCEKPLFDMFSTCVIVLVVNEEGEAALLRQEYISHKYYNLISGYMKPGETAEETARREVEEEIGIRISSLTPVETYWFGKKDMLMLGFFAGADKKDFELSGEVNTARWVPVEQALSMVHPEGSISYTLVKRYLSRKERQ